MTDRRIIQPKMAWGITGAGHFLTACIEYLLTLKEVDIFLSRAGEEVLHFYGLHDRLQKSNHTLILDESASCLSVTKLYTGKYDRVVIAPVTSNSIAKMAHGIADNLITNLFAHAGKCRIPTILLPCDSVTELKSQTPQGDQVAVYVREIDRMNIARVAGLDMVTLAGNPGQLTNLLKNADPDDRG